MSSEQKSDVIVNTPHGCKRVFATDVELAGFIHAKNLYKSLGIANQGILFEVEEGENPDEKFVDWVSDVFVYMWDNNRIWGKIAKGELPD